MSREGHIMSQCESCEVELSALMDGESSPARMVTLLDHLTGCPSCRQFYGELRRFQQVVDDLTTVETDTERVIPLETGDRTARPHAARLPRWAWGMAAALIVAVGLYATMDRFGGHWVGHAKRIAADWDARVGDDDLVLLAGDFSWGMTLGDVAEDLAWLRARPGQKVMVRGNHDYWWSTARKVRRVMPSGCRVVHNDACWFPSHGLAIAGSRLWDIPGLSHGSIFVSEVADPAPQVSITYREPTEAQLAARRIIAMIEM